MAATTLIARALRTLVVLLALVVFAGLVLVAGALLYVTTEKGERVVHDLAVRGVAAGGLGSLRLDGLEIDLPLSLRARRLALVDGERVWLEIDGLQVGLGTAALAAGNLRFSTLRADSLALGRFPEFPTSQQEVSWPRALIFDEVEVARVMLDGELLATDPEPVGPFSVRADGVLRLPSGSFRLDGAVTFAALDGASRDGSIWEAGPGTLDLDLARRDEMLRGTATITADRIGVGAIRFDAATVRAQLEPVAGFGQAIALDIAASPSALPEAAAFLFGRRLQATADLRLAADDSASARAVRAAEDAPLRTMALRLDGGAGVKLRVDAQEDPFTEGRTTGRLMLEGAQLVWPESKRSVLDVLGDRFSLSADFSLDQERAVAAHDIELAFGPLDARGEAKLGLEDSAIDATLVGGFADLALLTEYLGRATTGAADYRLVIGGKTEALALAVTARTTALSVENTQISNVDAAIDLTGLPAGPVAARISGHVGSDSVTLEANGHLTFDDGGVADVTASLSDGGDNHLNASGRLARDSKLPTGRLDADIANLADVSALLGIDVAGRVRADLTNDKQGLTGSAELAALRLPGGVQLDSLTIRTPAGVRDRVEAEAIGIQYGAVKLDRVSATAHREADLWQAHLVLHDEHGAIDLVADIEAREGVAAATRGFEATLTRLSGTAVGKTIVLVEPFVLRSPDGRTTRVTGELGIGEGHLNVDWSVAADASFGQIRAESFPLRYITPLVDETLWLDGNVAADIVVPRRYSSGDATKPVMHVTVRGARSADKAAAGKFVGFGLDARAEQRAADIVFTVVLSGGDADRLTLDGSVVTPSGGTPFGAVSAQSVLRATAEGGLGPRAVGELAALFDTRLYGTLSTDLQIAGSVGDPTLQGRVELGGGSFEDGVTGAILRDIELRLLGDSADLARLSVTANDGDQGSVSGKGHVDLSGGLGAPRLEANLELVGLRAARLDEVTGRVSGTLDLRAGRDELSLAGVLRTDELSVILPKRLPLEVVELTVIEENEQLLDGPRDTATTETPGLIADLALVIEVPGPAFVRSKEVTSEWRGRIEVGGTTAAPTVDGGLKLIRGDFAALGLRVVATEGRLRFDPSPDARHTLDIRGHVRRGGINVTIIIGGELKDLSVRLESEPPLPEDEILAFLLFGSSVSSLTPVQAVQLAAAVASLANPRSAADPLAWFRDHTGLDRVDIVENEAEEEAQYMLSAGKYVREGVFVSVDQPLGTGASEVSIELEVTDRLTLKSSVGADASGSVGASWTYDY